MRAQKTRTFGELDSDGIEYLIGVGSTCDPVSPSQRLTPCSRILLKIKISEGSFQNNSEITW